MHITYQIIYPFLKISIFVIYFIFTDILIFVLIHRITYIPSFWFESKQVMNQIKIYKYFAHP